MKSSWLFTIAFALAIVVLALNAGALTAGYAFKANMAEAAAATVAALLAITLFVERAMTVVNGILFGEAQRDALEDLRTAQPTAAAQVSRVMKNKERVRLLGAFLAGLFISAAGVRTLENLLVVVGEKNPFLFTVDVVLTAALIAGGSNGLAFLMQLAKNKLVPPPPHPQKIGGTVTVSKSTKAAAVTAATTATAATAAAAQSANAMSAAADSYFQTRVATTG